MKNLVFIVAGPSGVGKNHIINEVLNNFEELAAIPTYTTRPPRQDDKFNGNRICIQKKEFETLINNDELLEYKQYNQNFYGKKKSDFERVFNEGKSLILEIEAQGLDDYRGIFKDRLKALFVCYESLDIMRERIIKNRPDATDDDIERRVKIAKWEMNQKDRYDYIITNIENKPGIAVEKVFSIIKKELNR